MQSHLSFPRTACELTSYQLLTISCWLQGDFAQALMEGMAPQLDGMATSLNGFALNGILGSAVQNSAAASDDPAILACLGVRIGRAAGQYEKGAACCSCILQLPGGYALNNIQGSAVQHSAAASEDQAILACLAMCTGCVAGHHEENAACILRSHHTARMQGCSADSTGQQVLSTQIDGS